MCLNILTYKTIFLPPFFILGARPLLASFNKMNNITLENFLDMLNIFVAHEYHSSIPYV